MRLEAMIIQDIVYQKLRTSVQAALSYTRKPIRLFLRHMIQIHWKRTSRVWGLLRLSTDQLRTSSLSTMVYPPSRIHGPLLPWRMFQRHHE